MSCGGVSSFPVPQQTDAGHSQMCPSACPSGYFCAQGIGVPTDSVLGADGGGRHPGTDGGGGTGDAGQSGPVYCRPCYSDTDCGGHGNLCLLAADNNGYCGTVCTMTTVCPAGGTCQAIMQGTEHTYANECFPSDNLCP
jgi:hypothetical protein